MWYAGAKHQLESIVEWLKSADQDEGQWKAQTELAHACLAEMTELSEPTLEMAKRSTGRYAHNPAVDKLNRAMPHVRAMLLEMRIHSRMAALEHGETAIRRL